MHNWKTSEYLKEIMNKLSKKDKSFYEQLLKKIEEIINYSDIEHYKNLRYDMKDCKRVHIGHFVLVFKYDKLNDFVFFRQFFHNLL